MPAVPTRGACGGLGPHQNPQTRHLTVETHKETPASPSPLQGPPGTPPPDKAQGTPTGSAGLSGIADMMLAPSSSAGTAPAAHPTPACPDPWTGPLGPELSHGQRLLLVGAGTLWQGWLVLPQPHCGSRWVLRQGPCSEGTIPSCARDFQHPSQHLLGSKWLLRHQSWQEWALLAAGHSQSHRPVQLPGLGASGCFHHETTTALGGTAALPGPAPAPGLHSGCRGRSRCQLAPCPDALTSAQSSRSSCRGPAGGPPRECHWHAQLCHC